MGWSLGYLQPREPQLLDALFFSAGRALHLANSFESKRQYVLRMKHFAEATQADPIMELQEIISSLPSKKMLGNTLKDLASSSLGAHTSDFDLLDRARKARNFIAHEGASTGSVMEARMNGILAQAVRLRSAVAELAGGDNIVSQWCFHIDEPNQPVPRALVDAYPAMLDDWAFGHFGGLLDSQEMSAEDTSTPEAN
ncbi:hypothetical protein ACOZE3_18720 [Streptomyces cinereoruber]|uniref:hypothetical protein n=1 Tax=Streptomyces cinereoruber TaxID=67260 RepID=UPI003BF4D732